MTTLRRISCEEAADRAPFFVLDALAAGEAAEVREHLAACDRPHAEFAELGGVVPHLAQLPDQIEPRAELRERILAAVASEERAAASVPDDARPRLVRVDDTAPRTARRAPLFSFGGARRFAVPLAAVLAIALLGAWNLTLMREATEARQRAELVAQVLNLAGQPGSDVATLSGQGQAQGARGVAVLTADARGYLVVHGLRPAPAGQAYEAWFISDGQPRRAGMVQVKADGLAILTDLRATGPVEQIALTIERETGVDAPTSPPVVTGEFG